MELICTSIHVAHTQSKPLTNDITRKQIVRMPSKRHSLTLGFPQDDSASVLLFDELPTIREASARPGLERQTSASSEPFLIDLGDLASMLMPPKIVKHKGLQPSTKKYSNQRRSSCGF
mmetsp:Transcript_30382/g.50142  ORF Transcript_30382/g.50142 Transcript_30382/m.50142 type:complete len:118 (-) Transcript_30382:39-392(-)